MTVLADYISEDDLAAELGLTVRTLQPWRRQRIGLAFAELSGSVPPRGGARLAALARALNGAREEAGSVMTLESRITCASVSDSRYGCGFVAKCSKSFHLK